MSDSFAACNAFVTVHKDAKESNLVFVIFGERAAFDLLNLPLTDHGPKPQGGHVITKNIENGNQYIVFQYWIEKTANRMMRRRPILRTREYPEVSQHYEIILDGAVRRYSDGREVCQDNASGWRLYKERVREMVQRQNFRCSLCGWRISESTATFEHQRRRGMGAAWRDDRIVDAIGNWINSAAHWVCNSKHG